MTEAPGLLRSHDQWVLWQHEERDGDVTKVPLDPNSTGRADSTDSDTWSSFYQVVEQQDRGDGIGFVFTLDDMIVGIDLDDCRDPETGEVEPWAQQIIDDFGSYAEVSPSGTGIHIYIVGRKPGDRCRCDIENGHIEIYDQKRFFTVTGNHVEGTPREVEQRNDQLDELYHSLFDDQSQDDSEGHEGDGATATNLSDEELIEKAKSAKNGDRFERLWNGDISGYESHSEADLALCGHLAFWTGGDKARIERLFAQSKLSRDKWADREDYRKRTIDEALSGRTEYFEPSNRSQGEDIAGDMEAQVLDPYYRDEDSITIKTAQYRAAEVLAEYYSYLMPGEQTRNWRRTLHVYDGEGIYTPRGEEQIRIECYNLLESLANTRFIKQVIHHIENSHTITNQEQLQTAPERLVVANGILDLTTGELEDHTPDEYHQRRLDVAWNPDAECPEIDAFLHSVVEDGRVDTVYRFIAHTLYGAYPDEKALMLLGEGSNGKSVFLELVTKFLGQNDVSQQSLHSLTANTFSAQNLLGKSANIHADMSDQNVNSMRMFKNLTGGDTVQANVKYEQPVQFTNTATMMFACNELPLIKDDTPGNWRRWQLVEFPNTFRPGDDDYEPQGELEERLYAEFEGLLVRCVDEIQRWHETGIWFPDATPWEETRTRMRAAAEPVYDFAQVALRPGDDVLRKDKVREAAQRYGNEQGVNMPDKNSFGEKLLSTDLGITSGQATIDGQRRPVYKKVEFTDRGLGLLYDENRDHDLPSLDNHTNPRKVVLDKLKHGQVPEALLREDLDIDCDRWIPKLKEDGTIIVHDDGMVEAAQ